MELTEVLPMNEAMHKRIQQSMFFVRKNSDVLLKLREWRYLVFAPQ
jgi:hypothetical protein